MGTEAGRGPPVPGNHQCPFPGPQFCASRAYESSQADELSVPVGARVHVLETSDRGWWLCRCLWQGRALVVRPGADPVLTSPALPTGSRAAPVFFLL